MQMTQNQRLSAFIARTDTPTSRTSGPRGSDYSGRAFYNFTNNLWQVSGGYSQVGENFNPEVGFLPRRGYRRPEFRAFFQPQPKRWPWIRRISPHISYNSFYDFDGNAADPRSRTSTRSRFSRDRAAASAGSWTTPGQSRWRRSRCSTATAGASRFRRAQYCWGQNAFEYFHNPSARVTGTIRARIGNYYDGDFKGFELTSDYRITPKATASVGWTRQDIDLPYGNFVNNLVPVKANYSFTTLTNLSALLQYNGQTGQFSSNVRFAWLNRSGTGLFVVYNDRRDLLSSTALETLGRSFVVKYTRLIDF